MLIADWRGNIEQKIHIRDRGDSAIDRLPVGDIQLDAGHGVVQPEDFAPSGKARSAA